MEDGQFTRLYGRGKTIVARRLLDYGLPEGFEDLTVFQILHKVCQEAMNETKFLKTSPFEPDDGEEEPQTKKSKRKIDNTKTAMSGVVEYDKSGHAKGVQRSTIESQGFVKDANVCKVSDDGTESGYTLK